MTGLWNTYSLHIEMACLSYSSVITDENTLFENMFCVICNVDVRGLVISFLVQDV